MRSGILVAALGSLWSTGVLAYSASAHGQDNDEPVCPMRPRQDLDTKAASRGAIDAMNKKFYNSSEVIWSPSDPWWLSGVALTGVIDYMRKTNTRDYMDQVKNIIQVQRTQWPSAGGDFRAESTDDTGWWALAMVRMYDLTGDATYLNISIEDEAYMYKYWTSSPCGGGMYVDIQAKTYKNAIANELYIKLAASLHNRIANDTTYLSRAQTAWSWFQGSGMINSDSLINDGLASQKYGGGCSNNKLPVWTYNQGVVLGALVGQLMPLTPTPPPAFLTPSLRTLPRDLRLNPPHLSPHHRRRSPLLLLPTHPGRHPHRVRVHARRQERLQQRPAGLQGHLRVQPRRAGRRAPRRQPPVPGLPAAERPDGARAGARRGHGSV